MFTLKKFLLSIKDWKYTNSSIFCILLLRYGIVIFQLLGYEYKNKTDVVV